MYRTAFPQTPSSYMLLCIFIPISTDLKGEKNALLSAHSFCLINWRLSQVFLHTITVSFPEKKTWWMLRSWIVASLKKKKIRFLFIPKGRQYLLNQAVCSLEISRYFAQKHPAVQLTNNCLSGDQEENPRRRLGAARSTGE